MSWCHSAAPAAVLKSHRYLRVHGESGVACCCVQVDSVTLSIYCTASKRWKRNRRERKRKSSFHFSIFFDLPDHQLHASSGILTGVVPFHWGQKDKDGSYHLGSGSLSAAQGLPAHSTKHRGRLPKTRSCLTLLAQLLTALCHSNHRCICDHHEPQRWI